MGGGPQTTLCIVYVLLYVNGRVLGGSTILALSHPCALVDRIPAGGHSVEIQENEKDERV